MSHPRDRASRSPPKRRRVRGARPAGRGGFPPGLRVLPGLARCQNTGVSGPAQVLAQQMASRDRRQPNKGASPTRRTETRFQIASPRWRTGPSVRDFAPVRGLPQHTSDAQRRRTDRGRPCLTRAVALGSLVLIAAGCGRGEAQPLVFDSIPPATTAAAPAVSDTTALPSPDGAQVGPWVDVTANLAGMPSECGNMT